MDGSKSAFMNTSMANHTTFSASRLQGGAGDNTLADIRRHVERLMLRLDFNGRFSSNQWKGDIITSESEKNILAQGGL
jgi:gamma-tubulin complex component 4